MFKIAMLVGWLAMPASGWACSCLYGTQGLASTLKEARAQAGFIYLGRVRDQENPSDGFATVDVVEAFKGSVKVGDVLQLPYGWSGDCLLSLPPGQTWLLYAGDTSPEEVWRCSRSRRIFSDDSELTWLRTGVLPPVPVSLQREAVSCKACDIDAIGGRLVAPPELPPATPASHSEAEVLWKKGQPFFTTEYAETDEEHRVLFGMSREGRAFELTEGSGTSRARKACERRVQLRWCKRLELRQRAAKLFAFHCVDPREAQEVCDEQESRKSEWLPMERLPARACSWFDPSAPNCELAEARFPFPAGAPPLPVLACHPRTPAARSGSYACEVKTAPEPGPPEP
ncbi:hypothetical protein [Corallococcus aberystwythensis]|uniref:Lipoprotein n=1 Tax=Corallococcus aberystwythensis TaxID=2316722 RepID=A0A3A8PWJ8_9BACT|nr:hypothetical protein [Corallococcus aberystwythensis]RKH60827.1 hypothetical protein D7W81_24910 [Corallococcus aberystwythensis]